MWIFPYPNRKWNQEALDKHAALTHNDDALLLTSAHEAECEAQRKHGQDTEERQDKCNNTAIISHFIMIQRPPNGLEWERRRGRLVSHYATVTVPPHQLGGSGLLQHNGTFKCTHLGGKEARFWLFSEKANRSEETVTGSNQDWAARWTSTNKEQTWQRHRSCTERSAVLSLKPGCQWSSSFID